MLLPKIGTQNIATRALAASLNDLSVDALDVTSSSVKFGCCCFMRVKIKIKKKRYTKKSTRNERIFYYGSDDSWYKEINRNQTYGIHYNTS